MTGFSDINRGSPLRLIHRALAADIRSAETLPREHTATCGSAKRVVDTYEPLEQSALAATKPISVGIRYLDGTCRCNTGLAFLLRPK